MKRFLQFTLIALVLISCNKTEEDETSEKDLFGTWNVVGIDDEVWNTPIVNESPVLVRSTAQKNVSGTITFNRKKDKESDDRTGEFDLTYDRVWYMSPNNATKTEVKTEFTWSKSIKGKRSFFFMFENPNYNFPETFIYLIEKPDRKSLVLTHSYVPTAGNNHQLVYYLEK